MHTARDGLRWHRIEAAPGLYDWSSLKPMIAAANATGMQVIWDLCHWGIPDWLDVFSAEFPRHFTAFAVAACEFLMQQRLYKDSRFLDLFCPINEISFWSWIGGDLEYFYPHGRGRGPELKRQLVRASLAAVQAIRKIYPETRFVHAEPIIHICADVRRPQDAEAAANYTASQFEAWDMIAGRRDPELGGFPSDLDIVGVNYYWNNQWIHNGERAPLGHPQHRPLHLLLSDVWERYRRPILITETGAEQPSGAGWLGYVSAEVRLAQNQGIPVLGICLYPVMDYPGWDDARHCSCGLIQIDQDWSARHLRPDMVRELRIQAHSLPAQVHAESLPT